MLKPFHYLAHHCDPTLCAESSISGGHIGRSCVTWAPRAKASIVVHRLTTWQASLGIEQRDCWKSDLIFKGAILGPKNKFRTFRFSLLDSWLEAGRQTHGGADEEMLVGLFRVSRYLFSELPVGCMCLLSVSAFFNCFPLHIKVYLPICGVALLLILM